jgi:hypothetical protein
MYDEHEPHSLYKAMLEEHRDLMHKIHDLRTWLEQIGDYGRPRFGELGMRIQPLRDELQHHFEEEEADGYLVEALAIAPQFAREAEELRQQHGGFLNELDALIGKLCEREPRFTGWMQARDGIEAILTRIRKHEGRETAIVQAAFGDDIGPAD